MDGLTMGRIVHYVLTEEDEKEINRRRVPGVGHSPNWPPGAQAHVGNEVCFGDHYPAMVVAVYKNIHNDRGTVNLQVFLDGNDTYWVEVADYSEMFDMGTWHWIEKA